MIQKFCYHGNMISSFSLLSVLKIMILFWTCGVMCFAVTADHLKLLLSFAVGGLLGDVFLHLLPEAWGHVNDGNVCFFQFQLHNKTPITPHLFFFLCQPGLTEQGL